MKSFVGGSVLVIFSAAILLVTGVLAPPVGGAEGEKEMAVAIASLEPEVGGTRIEDVVIGGAKHDDGLRFTLANGARWDVGEGYDLLEGFVGLDERSWEKTDVLTVKEDGETLSEFPLNKRDRVRFISCPLGRCRLLTLRGIHGSAGISDSHIAFVKLMLIRGRTTPSQPTDVYFTPGQPEYLAAGWYNFIPRE